MKYKDISYWFDRAVATREGIVSRFWSKVTVGEPDECWEWAGGRTRNGYGQFAFTVHGRSTCKNFRAPRVAYWLSSGSDPESLYVLHACDNPGCVNPAHLTVGTQSENMAQCRERGRTKKGYAPAPWKAKLVPAQVREIRRLISEGWAIRKTAREMGVAQGVVQGIVHRRTYLWVE